MACRVGTGVWRLLGLPSSVWYSSSMILARRTAWHIKIANRKRVEMFMGQRFHSPTRLRMAAPDIAEEWDATKNPGHLYPEIVGVGHMEGVWWRCRKCELSYRMSVEKRVVRGYGCPQCREERKNIDESNDLSGEQNSSLRAKRPPMLTIRTKY